MRVNNIKNPTTFIGKNVAVMEMQTQMKFLQLNRMKYTGFIEFRKARLFSLSNRINLRINRSKNQQNF